MKALRSLPKYVVLFSIHVYQHTLGVILLPTCRFAPSCSEYMRQAIDKHGVVHGAKISIARLLRCHPLSDGGSDPIPGQPR